MPNDLLSHSGDLLELFPFGHNATGEPQTEAAAKDALHGGAVKRSVAHLVNLFKKRHCTIKRKEQKME